MPGRTKSTKFDASLFDEMEKTLYSPVISDILDDFGVRAHTLNEKIKPLERDYVVAGRAATALFGNTRGTKKNPYSRIISFIDGLKGNDVAVVGGSECSTAALWGELLSTAARARGARGAVVDGYVRDTRKMLEMDYRVFAIGQLPDDSKGRADVVGRDCTLKSGRATVSPGDIVFGDSDGVVSIPKAIAADVVGEAFSKAAKENVVKRELQRGRLLKDVWSKYRVL